MEDSQQHRDISVPLENAVDADVWSISVPLQANEFIPREELIEDILNFFKHDKYDTTELHHWLEQHKVGNSILTHGIKWISLLPMVVPASSEMLSKFSLKQITKTIWSHYYKPVVQLNKDFKTPASTLRIAAELNMMLSIFTDFDQQYASENQAYSSYSSWQTILRGLLKHPDFKDMYDLTFTTLELIILTIYHLREWSKATLSQNSVVIWDYSETIVEKWKKWTADAPDSLSENAFLPSAVTTERQKKKEEEEEEEHSKMREMARTLSRVMSPKLRDSLTNLQYETTMMNPTLVSNADFQLNPASLSHITLTNPERYTPMKVFERSKIPSIDDDDTNETPWEKLRRERKAQFELLYSANVAKGNQKK